MSTGKYLVFLFHTAMKWKFSFPIFPYFLHTCISILPSPIWFVGDLGPRPPPPPDVVFQLLSYSFYRYFGYFAFSLLLRMFSSSYSFVIFLLHFPPLVWLLFIYILSHGISWYSPPSPRAGSIFQNIFTDGCVCRGLASFPPPLDLQYR